MALRVSGMNGMQDAVASPVLNDARVAMSGNGFSSG
jgi:hypothetical protein